MFRVDTSSAVGAYGGFAPAGTPGHFASGNPAVGQRGTIPGCDWFEGLQEEMMSLLQAGNIVAQKGNVRQIYQSILAMQLLVDTGTGGANALVCTPLVPFDNLNLNTIIWVLPAATNTGPATLNIGVGGNVALTRNDGSPLQPTDYMAGQPFATAYRGGNWIMLIRRVRQQLGGAAVLTCNSGTGNDATGGLANPFATLQGAYNWIAQNIDAAGNAVQVNCTGNFTSGLAAQAPINGINNAANLIFNFTAGATLNTAGDCLVLSGAGSVMTVQGGLTLASANGNGIRIFDDANIAIAGINFGACPNAEHIVAAEGPRVTLNAGGYTISGSAQAHYYLYDAARIRSGSLPAGITNINVVGNPNFSNAFAVAGQLSLISVPSNFMAFVGNATGVRYIGNMNSVINTSGGGVGFFPGSAPGTIATGAQYG
jgi:hypothetical protein